MAPDDALVALWRPVVERVAKATRVSLEVEERVQEGWVACLEAVRAYDDRRTDTGNREAWVAQRIRWRIIDAERRQRRRYAVTPVMHGSTMIEIVHMSEPHSQPRWLEQFWAADCTEAVVDVLWVRQALASLEMEDCRALTWRFVDGLPWVEIGRRVGLTESGAYRRYRPAMDELGERLRAA